MLKKQHNTLVTNVISNLNFVKPSNTSSYIFQTVNSIVCINSFSCPTDKFVTNVFTLLRPHVETAPTFDPLASLTRIFDTYRRTLQTLIQLHFNDIHTRTMSTLHTNDVFKILIHLETRSSITKPLENNDKPLSSFSSTLIIFLKTFFRRIFELYLLKNLSHKNCKS